MTGKLLVTGYGGFVAGSLIWQARRSTDWDIHALSLHEPAQESTRFQCTPLDLRDTDALHRVFHEASPDAVIHTAALADIDYCESHPDAAELVNVGVTEELVALCSESGARLILCSSDSIFDGRKGMYKENDPPSPLNVYAETKVRAEEAMRSLRSQGVVARLSLVMGLPVLGAGNSFLAKMLESLERGEKVSFPSNEIRTPVDVITVGRALLELASSDFSGIIQLAGSTCLTRHEMARRIASELGHNADRVLEIDSNSIPGRAPRPSDASLDNTKAARTLGTPMLTLIQGLTLVMKMKALQRGETAHSVS